MAIAVRIVTGTQPLASAPLVDDDNTITAQWLAFLTRPPTAALLQTRGTPVAPTWTAGTDAPSAVAPVGSLYSRGGGAVGATLYVSRGAGVWAAVAGV